MAAVFRFGPFLLDGGNRRLESDGRAIDLNARYFDALALLLASPGQLVSKDRFLSEVWRGVPVTDEALTQCIRTLRRQLGDDAARPRFIETVPKHGYRFIAPVELVVPPNASYSPAAVIGSAPEFIVTAIAGVIGGGLAGAVGGLIYGFVAASSPSSGVGGISALLVLLSVTTLVAILGAAAVSAGIAAASRLRTDTMAASVAGGAIGGLLIGAFGKLLGHDLFALVIGRSPGEITGAAEGLILGGAVGCGSWLARRQLSFAGAGALAAGCGAIAGLLISAIGGRLMLGSLELLARSMPESRLRLDQLGRLFGEQEFGTLTLVAGNVLESALFSACIGLAITAALRRGEFRRRSSAAAAPA